MNVATFGPASLPAQLAELKRERADRTDRRDEMDLAAKRATAHEIAHRNNALDGAIKTLETLVSATGQPGRRELIEVLREARQAFADQVEADIDFCCPKLPDGSPDEGKMDEQSRPMIEATREFIARMDALLERIPT